MYRAECRLLVQSVALVALHELLVASERNERELLPKLEVERVGLKVVEHYRRLSIPVVQSFPVVAW